MSFYGNTYHYTSEAFARIVLLNSGLEDYLVNFEDNDDYGLVPKDTAIPLKAEWRESGLGVESGNNWIQLTYSKSKPVFQIRHNAPHCGENNIFIQPIEKEDPSLGVNISKDYQLDFEDILKVPTIAYDEAGHIANIKEACYYKMPRNPVRPLEERMNKIDGLTVDGKPSEPDGGSLQQTLRNEMAVINKTMEDTLANIKNIETNINNTADTLQEGLDNLETLKNNSESAATDAANALSTASGVNYTLNNLIADLQKKGVI